MAPAETFGVHLMLDCYDADPRRLRDVGHLSDLLRDLPVIEEPFCPFRV